MSIFSRNTTLAHPALVLEQSQSSVDSALSWLVLHENKTTGSYGDFEEHQTAAAAYGLWLNDSASGPAALAYDYLAQRLNGSLSWFWGTEADVPGDILFSTAITQHLQQVDSSAVESRLLSLQQQNGGFLGWWDGTRTVTSSVDTAMALWGLSNAGLIPSSNRTAAANYILTLQNPDGSFNLTKATVANPIYSLGPDQTAITALAILVLRDNGFDLGVGPILSGIDFLSRAASIGYGGPGHVYDAALSFLAFLEYYQPRNAILALTYLMGQQNSDGGFSDVSRTNRDSDALDTGWASIALQYAIRKNVNVQGPVNQPPTARFSFSPENPANGTIVSFDAGSSHDLDGDNLQYNWTFGDGSSAFGQRVTHSYFEKGTYTVTLTVTDSGVNPDGLTGTTWHNITVQASQTPSRTATQPGITTSTLEIVLAGLFMAVALVAGYLFIGTNKNRHAKVRPSPAQAATSTGSARERVRSTISLTPPLSI